MHPIRAPSWRFAKVSDRNAVQAAALQLTVPDQLPVGIALALDFTIGPKGKPKHALKRPREALEALNRMKRC